MSYLENPKTKGSGIICAIPQTTRCPVNCKDCFFQSGRSYLEPIEDNLPNLPDPEWANRNRYVVRINDGNDSNSNREEVVKAADNYNDKFYNTSIPKDLEEFDAPVVLTLNPGKMTDEGIHILDQIPDNLMFVRVRTNTWNTQIVQGAIDYYTEREVPVILTFMAYHDDEDIPKDHRGNYIHRKRTSNSYYAITSAAWKQIMDKYTFNYRVYSCGRVEGERGKTACRICGNCLREYFSTREWVALNR